MRAEQSCGDPRSLCGYTQGRNISSSFFVNLDPCLGQGKKLWYVLRLYLDPEIDSYRCKTIPASSKKEISNVGMAEFGSILQRSSGKHRRTKEKPRSTKESHGRSKLKPVQRSVAEAAAKAAAIATIA